MSAAKTFLAIAALALALSARSSPARAQQPGDKDVPTPGGNASGNASATGAQSSPAGPAAELRAPAATAAAAATQPGAPSPGATEPVPATLVASEAAESEAPSWFTRAPLTVAVGQGAQRWTLTFFGFIEADTIADSTRSYNDAIGSAIVARSDTYDGRVGRTQLSMRNTRLGMAFASPVIAGVRPSAVLEGDFFGNQPSSPPSTSESAYYDSPTFRIRHAYLKLQNDVVDVLAGQTYDLFGWQNYFSPCTAEFLGLPNMVFSREPQVRLSHSFGARGPVSVDVAVAAVRPGQRDSQVPDGDAGLRLSVNGWKGITTPGNVGTVALPLSIGVSARVRQFKVDAFTPPPTQTSNQISGWGLSVDALIPIIPADNANDRANRLTLTGSFVTGTGIADLLTTGGGASFPTLPNPAQASPPPAYTADVDNGLVTFDKLGVLHTINWRAFKAGLQYYLPGSGRVILAANYTQAHSSNMAQLFPMGGAEIELLGAVADTSRYADVNLFWDATPAVRFGLSAQYTQVHYLDGDQPHNLRGMGQAVYVF
jgi:hypothetical protein